MDTALARTLNIASGLNIQSWGSVPYQEALSRQLSLVDSVAAGASPDQLVFCTHPPVVTLGRGSKPNDLVGWTGETLNVSRGGRATYHGPGQILIYPIINLSRPRIGLASKDVHAYLRLLEATLVEVLREIGISAEPRTKRVQMDGEELSVTGVWAGDRKIASIGIAVSRWVSYHGVALNLDADELAFTGIRPCGFSRSDMTSVEESLGYKVSRDLIEDRLARVFEKRLV